MSQLLKFSKELSFPLDVVTEKLAFLGQSGGGKTYDAMKLAELMLEAGAQIVALDIPGAWKGLRSSADGKSPGFKILVIGGEHGDLPINANAGKMIADLVVDTGMSVVLDVSEMLDDEQATFLTAFLSQLFDRKKRNRSPMHVFFEEAQEIVPEERSVGKLQAKLRAISIRMMKIGRNYGLGWSAISQEPQAVSKRALNQAGTVIAVRTVGSHERKALADWAKSKLRSKEQMNLIDELPELEKGQAIAWSPGWLKFAGLVHVLSKVTFDSSKTPEVGKQRPQAKVMADIDIEKLKTDMAALVEQKEAEDPVLLKKKLSVAMSDNARLRAELVKRNAATPPALGVQKVTTREKKVVLTSDLKRVEAVFARNDATIAKMEAGLRSGGEKLLADFRTTLVPALERLCKLIGEAAVVDAPTTRIVPLLIGPKSGAPTVKTYTTQKEIDADFGKSRFKVFPEAKSDGPLTKYGGSNDDGRDGSRSGPISKGERSVLIAVAQHTEGVTREQIMVLTNYKRSSRDTYLQKLSAAGHVRYEGERIYVTTSGQDALGPDFAPLPTGDALREHWLQRLPEGERRVLEVVLASYPSAIEREKIDEATSYKRSSRDTYLQKLSSRRLVIADRGTVKASPMLFEVA